MSKVYHNYYIQRKDHWVLQIVSIRGDRDILRAGTSDTTTDLLELWKQNNCIEITEVIIDEDDIPRLQEVHWAIAPVTGYARGMQRKVRKNSFMHRFIMDAPADKVVDHINRNKLDNRKRNLRVCSQQENSHNKDSCNIRLTRNGKYSVYATVDGIVRAFGTHATLSEAEAVKAKIKSDLMWGKPVKWTEPAKGTGERYVKWHKRDKEFAVVMPVKGERTYVGTYKTLEDAIASRDQQLKHEGED